MKAYLTFVRKKENDVFLEGKAFSGSNIYFKLVSFAFCNLYVKSLLFLSYSYVLQCYQTFRVLRVLGLYFYYISNSPVF
jgi:hypothetical protein